MATASKLNKTLISFIKAQPLLFRRDGRCRRARQHFTERASTSLRVESETRNRLAQSVGKRQ